MIKVWKLKTYMLHQEFMKTQTIRVLEVRVAGCSNSHNRDPERKGRRVWCGGATMMDRHRECHAQLVGTAVLVEVPLR